ncbi:MAG: hypothetical protein PHV43_03405, partial [Candidatus Colwellbacteria bacterium]|nr:hypothetical protein [Candidatus Colwellbacteria bacterium]
NDVPDEEPEITSFTATYSGKGDEYSYRFAWTSEHTSYCRIGDSGAGYFGRYDQYDSSDSVLKSLKGLNRGTFTLYCYDSTGDYDTKPVTVVVAKSAVLGISVSLEDIAKQLQEIQALIDQLKAEQN